MSGMINFIYLQSKIIFIIYKKILKIRYKYCSRFQASSPYMCLIGLFGIISVNRLRMEKGFNQQYTQLHISSK